MRFLITTLSAFLLFLLAGTAFAIVVKEIDIEDMNFNFQKREIGDPRVRTKVINKQSEKDIDDIKHSYQTKNKLVTKGKGIWVNIWNYPDDAQAFIKKLRKYDIDTIYLQINRSTTDIFKHPEKLDELLVEAHRRRIKVIGWSYCYLNHNISLDVRKFIEPALYVSPSGHMLDGMAADIEENVSLSAVKLYTEKIKAQLPNDYPLIAIVFSPRIKSQYPWQYIGQNWDILMPMTYWHGLKRRDYITVYNFVKDTVVKMRELTGIEDLNIHLITDGERTTPEEVKVSLDAAKDFNVNAGVSIYPEHLATEEMLEVMKRY